MPANNDARELSILYAIGQVASQSLELGDVLNASLDSVLEILGVDAGTILLLEPDGQTMTMSVHRGFSESFVSAMRHIRLGEGVAGRAAADRKPAVVDIADYPSPHLATHFIKDGFQTIASSPLLSKGKLLGALSLVSQRACAFAPSDLELLAAIGRQLGTAVDNARFHQETQQQVEHLAILTRIAKAVSTTLHLNELLEVIYREVTAVMEADAFYIALYDPLANDMDYRLQVDQGVREPPARAPLTSGLTSLVVTTKKPLLIGDLPTELHRLPPLTLWGSMEPPASWLGVPMTIGDQLVGVISVQSYRPQAYDQGHLNLLTTIAAQTALMVENARLFETEQRRAARLADIVQLGSELAGLRDVGILLQTLVSRTMRLAESSTCSVMLMDDSGREAVLSAQVGLSEDPAFELRVPVGLPAIQESVASGQPLIIADIDQDMPEMRSVLVRTDIRSFCAYPMMRQGRVLGFITLSNLLPRLPSSEEVTTYQLLAELAASALDNAQLYERTRARMRELSALTQVGDSLNRALELEQILGIVLRQAMGFVGRQEGTIVLNDPATNTLRIVASHGLPAHLVALFNARPVYADEGTFGGKQGQPYAGLEFPLRRVVHAFEGCGVAEGSGNRHRGNRRLHHNGGQPVDGAGACQRHRQDQELVGELVVESALGKQQDACA